MLSRIFITVDDYRGVMLNNCLQYSSEKKATGMASSSASSTCLRQNARSVYYRNLRFVYTFFLSFFFYRTEVVNNRTKRRETFEYRKVIKTGRQECVNFRTPSVLPEVAGKFSRGLISTHDRNRTAESTTVYIFKQHLRNTIFMQNTFCIVYRNTITRTPFVIRSKPTLTYFIYDA